MLRIKRVLLCGMAGFLVLALAGLGNVTSARAQYWQALPPYNVLWPLWSTVYSPVDPGTGLSTPLVTELSSDTVLPVQPSLVWDPAMEFPFLLYNVPADLGGGLMYFTPFYGLNFWPTSYLVDPLTDSPMPITLPLGYESLSPTDILAIRTFYNAANTTYAIIYPPAQFGYSYFDFLTPAEVWGLPPL
ncbi:MAG: hypothetical protein ACMUIA_05725 [bacterium]